MQKEKPDVVTKLMKMATTPLEELLIENTKAGFPNR